MSLSKMHLTSSKPQFKYCLHILHMICYVVKNKIQNKIFLNFFFLCEKQVLSNLGHAILEYQHNTRFHIDKSDPTLLVSMGWSILKYQLVFT